MPVLKYQDAEVQQVASGIERRIVYTENMLTAIIDFSNGPAAEPDAQHSHPHEQISYVASGEVMFFMEDEEPQHLKAGDLFFVPSGKLHGIQLLTASARLVDSFTPVRADFLK